MHIGFGNSISFYRQSGIYVLSPFRTNAEIRKDYFNGPIPSRERADMRIAGLFPLNCHSEERSEKYVNGMH